MDRENDVDLLNDNSLIVLAFYAISRCTPDQPIGNLVDTPEVLQLSVFRLIDLGQHSLCRAGERDRALEITMPPMFDSGVDLPSMHSGNKSRCGEGYRFACSLYWSRVLIEADASRHS
jgi:hypothetical protein